MVEVEYALVYLLVALSLFCKSSDTPSNNTILLIRVRRKYLGWSLSKVSTGLCT
jgi:hypothetical protein